MKNVVTAMVIGMVSCLMALGCAGGQVVGLGGATTVKTGILAPAIASSNLFFQSPLDSKLHPTKEGNEHLGNCISHAARKLAVNNRINMELRYEPGDEEEGSSIIAIIEEGRVGVEVYENGVEKYSQYRDITVEDAAHACEFFREIAEKASHDVGSTSSTRTVSQADDSFDDDEEDFAEDAEAEDDDEEGFEEDAEAESADAEADAEEEAESAEADAEPEPDPDSFEVEE